MSTSDVPYLLYLGASLYVPPGPRKMLEIVHEANCIPIPAVSVLTDLTCSLMPFPILWSLQITPRKKIGVGLLMVMGAVYGRHHQLRGAHLG